MKVLLLLSFIIASALASGFYDALDNAAEEAVLGFVRGMDNAPSLSVYLERPETEGLQQVEEDIKVQLKEKIRIVVYDVVQRARLVVDDHYEMHRVLTTEITEFVLQAQELTVQLKDKPQEKQEILKPHVSNFLEKLSKKIHKLRYGLEEVENFFVKEFSFANLVARVKELIVKTFDYHKTVAYLKTVLGEAHEFATSILSTIFEKGKHLVESIVDHFLPTPVHHSNSVAQRRRALGIRTVACFIVGLVTKGFGAEYIIDWIKSKVPENWKGPLFDAISHGGTTLLKIVAKSLCLGSSPPKASVVSDMVNKLRSLFDNLGSVAQNDFVMFGDWMRTVWNAGFENAKNKFTKFEDVAHKLVAEVKVNIFENINGAKVLLEMYKEVLGEYWQEIVEKLHNFFV